MRYIGSIQATTQANLQYCMLHMLTMKVIQCESRRYLIGYKWPKLLFLLYCFGSSAYYRHQLCNFVLTNKAPFDTHSLTKRVQIRLCIEASAHTSFTQDAFNISCS